MGWRQRFALTLVVGLLALGGLWYGRRVREPGARSVSPADPASSPSESPDDASRLVVQDPVPVQPPAAGGDFAARYGDFLTGAAARFALARPHPSRPIPSLGMSELRGLREARIVCLSDPERAGLFLKDWVLDEGRPVPQRTFSIWVLAGMGIAGQETALDRLKEIGRNCLNKEIKAVAIGHLALLTGDRETQGLVMKALRDPDLHLPGSAVMLTYDPEKVGLLRSISERKGHPTDMIQRREDFLSTANGRQKMLEAAGTYRADVPGVYQQWQMDAAWVNRLPGLKEALRKRMDDHWVEAQVYNRSLRQQGRLEDPSSVEEQYARGTGGEAIVDELHDEALLYYWRLGGELKEHEWKRLHYHGFVGDQSEHLRQIISGR